MNIETLSNYFVPQADIANEDWGLIEYREAHSRQEQLAEAVFKGQRPSTLVMCSHPAIVTMGRKASADDLCGWQGEIAEVNRGGRATYHGPSQIVAYPIVDLRKYGCDLNRYLRLLEKSIVQTLAEFSILAAGKSEEHDTGVWVGSKKIASLGIGVRNWISMHGLALNVDFDPTAFRGVNPCGLNAETMISMEQILGEKLNRKTVQDTLAKNLHSNLTMNSQAVSAPTRDA